MDHIYEALDHLNQHVVEQLDGRFEILRRLGIGCIDLSFLVFAYVLDTILSRWTHFYKFCTDLLTIFSNIAHAFKHRLTELINAASECCGKGKGALTRWINLTHARARALTPSTILEVLEALLLIVPSVAIILVYTYLKHEELHNLDTLGQIQHDIRDHEELPHVTTEPVEVRSALGPEVYFVAFTTSLPPNDRLPMRNAALLLLSLCLGLLLSRTCRYVLNGLLRMTKSVKVRFAPELAYVVSIRDRCKVWLNRARVDLYNTCVAIAVLNIAGWNRQLPLSQLNQYLPEYFYQYSDSGKWFLLICLLVPLFVRFVRALEDLRQSFSMIFDTNTSSWKRFQDMFTSLLAVLGLFALSTTLLISIWDFIGVISRIITLSIDIEFHALKTVFIVLEYTTHFCIGAAQRLIILHEWLDNMMNQERDVPWVLADVLNAGASAIVVGGVSVISYHIWRIVRTLLANETADFPKNADREPDEIAVGPVIVAAADNVAAPFFAEQALHEPDSLLPTEGEANDGDDLSEATPPSNMTGSSRIEYNDTTTHSGNGTSWDSSNEIQKDDSIEKGDREDRSNTGEDGIRPDKNIHVESVEVEDPEESNSNACRDEQQYHSTLRTEEIEVAASDEEEPSVGEKINVTETIDASTEHNTARTMPNNDDTSSGNLVTEDVNSRSTDDAANTSEEEDPSRVAEEASEPHIVQEHTTEDLAGLSLVGRAAGEVADNNASYESENDISASNGHESESEEEPAVAATMPAAKIHSTFSVASAAKSNPDVPIACVDQDPRQDHIEEDLADDVLPAHEKIDNDAIENKMDGTRVNKNSPANRETFEMASGTMTTGPDSTGNTDIIDAITDNQPKDPSGDRVTTTDRHSQGPELGSQDQERAIVRELPKSSEEAPQESSVQGPPGIDIETEETTVRSQSLSTEDGALEGHLKPSETIEDHDELPDTLSFTPTIFDLPESPHPSTPAEQTCSIETNANITSIPSLSASTSTHVDNVVHHDQTPTDASPPTYRCS